MIKIYAPASIGNISVGFDVLGAAIQPIDGTLLGDCVEIKSAHKFKLINKGTFSFQLPKNPKKNIIWQSWKKFCKILGKSIPVSITLYKNMPIGSGLGSSACSIVAGLVSLNQFLKKPIKKNDLLKLMGKMEKSICGSVHYDNVAPCYLGGIQLIIEKKKIISQNIPIFKNWLWIVAWPGTKIPTSKSRKILPKKYNLQTCIKHSQNLARFIHASYTSQPKLASISINDVIAEPYRIQLLPKMLKVKKKVKKIGAIGCGISGSGPTLFCICDNIKKAKKIAHWLKKNYVENSKGFVQICKIDNTGTRQIGLN